MNPIEPIQLIIFSVVWVGGVAILYFLIRLSNRKQVSGFSTIVSLTVGNVIVLILGGLVFMAVAGWLARLVIS